MYNLMDITVVIPTYNRVDRLPILLSALEQQDFPMDKFEVIIVSDGATDATNEFLQTINTPLHLKPLIQENQGPAAARNHGWQSAVGNIIVFIDDDIVPVPNLITQHLLWHEKYGDNVVVFGPMATPDDFDMSPWIAWEQAMLQKQYDAIGNNMLKPSARQFYTGNTSLARVHLETVGGFDERFLRAEDLELSYRLADQGLEFVFNPMAIGYHYAERSFNSWLAIPYAYGQNDVIFTQEKEQTWLLPRVFQEYQRRHFLIRFLTWLCLDHERLSKYIVGFLKSIVLSKFFAKRRRWTTMSCSAIFNLRYYQGIADELGGRHNFFEGIKEAKEE